MIARPGVQARRCHVVVEMHEHVTSSVHLSQAPTPVTLPKCSPSMAFRSTFRQAYGPKGSRNRPAATPVVSRSSAGRHGRWSQARTSVYSRAHANSVEIFAGADSGRAFVVGRLSRGGFGRCGYQQQRWRSSLQGPLAATPAAAADAATCATTRFRRRAPRRRLASEPRLTAACPPGASCHARALMVRGPERSPTLAS
jgi:hypothetical protein